MEAKAAEAQAEEYDEGEELEEEAGGHRFLFFTARCRRGLSSMVVHAVALLVMAMITVGGNVEQVKAIITAAPGEDLQEIEEFEEQLTPPVDVDAVMTDAAIPVDMITEAIPEDVTDVVVSNDIDQAAISVELVTTLAKRRHLATT